MTDGRPGPEVSSSAPAGRLFPGRIFAAACLTKQHSPPGEQP